MALRLKPASCAATRWVCVAQACARFSLVPLSALAAATGFATAPAAQPAPAGQEAAAAPAAGATARAPSAARDRAPTPAPASPEPAAGTTTVSPTSDAASTSSPARGSRTPAPRAAGGKRRVVLDEELTIEGQLDKPNAFYVLSRAALDVDWARLDARFVPLVLESGQDPLF